MTKALLSDIPSIRSTYKAGDRFLVRVGVDLTADQTRRICKAVKTYAGVDVRVLVVNCFRFGIVWHHKQFDFSSRLTDISDLNETEFRNGVAELNLSTVEIQDGDLLQVYMPNGVSALDKERIQWVVQEWAGKDIEVRVQTEEEIIRGG